MVAAFLLGLILGSVIFTLIWYYGVGKCLWRLYAKAIKSHAQDLDEYEKIHRHWATSLKKYGISLMHNGCSSDEWPETLDGKI